MHYHTFLFISMCDLFQIWPVGIDAFLPCQAVENVSCPVAGLFPHVIKVGSSHLPEVGPPHAEGCISLCGISIYIYSQTYRFMHQIFLRTLPLLHLTQTWQFLMLSNPLPQSKMSFSPFIGTLRASVNLMCLSLPYSRGARRRKFRVLSFPLNSLAGCLLGFLIFSFMVWIMLCSQGLCQ